MFNLNIGQRLVIMMLVQIVVLVATGIVAIVGLNKSNDFTGALNARVSEVTRLGLVVEDVRGDLLANVNRVNNGEINWQSGKLAVTKAVAKFEKDWASYYNPLTGNARVLANQTIVPKLDGLRQGFAELQQIFAGQNQQLLTSYVMRKDAKGLSELQKSIDPFLNAVKAKAGEARDSSRSQFAAASKINKQYLTYTAVLLTGAAVMSLLLGLYMIRKISTPLKRLSRTVSRVMDGEYDARSELRGDDELGQLGIAIDSMLDEKVTSLIKAEQDNEALNKSVMTLLEGVAKLGDRDLTVTVPVTTDVTGPVADAVNSMAEETAQVLKRVSAIAQRVQTSAQTVNEKATAVNQAAELQQLEVEQATKGFAQTAETFSRITEVARLCDSAGEKAGDTTREAMQSVSDSLEGMGEIRESIQETAKRIKRLGERSNEITAIVDIINMIAERTHVLALNASMQAAAAGDAGRGFAVVADEVQRLAESARESTAQISSLVKNIQIDTNDTISTMDRTIEQVVEGTRLAEVAEARMQETQKSTLSLVDSVKDIAAQSQEQEYLSTSLKEGAMQALARTRQTAKEVIEQIGQTRNLVQYAEVLSKSVRVFKLPV